MHPSFPCLAALLVLTAGCRHTNAPPPRPVPTLPASHGHLSLSLALYLDPSMRLPGLDTSIPTAETVVEPAQAPAVFAEARQVLAEWPTQEQVRAAWVDLGAACEAPLKEACDFLREQFTRPVRLEGEDPPASREAIASGRVAMSILRCRLGIDGRLRACEVLERAPHGYTETLLEALPGMRYQPARLAGHPVEISYTFTSRIAPPGMELSPEQELRWARQRTEHFPQSPYAWAALAQQLALQAPEDPGYPSALRHLNALAPRDWWSANELAWLHARAGRYSEAEHFAKRAREGAPRNAYVLETSAATQAGLGACAAAVADQRTAVELLPAEWPVAERERFQHTLREYSRRCPADGR